MSCRGKFFLTLGALTAFLAAANAVMASESVTVLYPFDGASGSLPSGMIQDPAGNFYGTALSGGGPPCRCGAIFELSLDSSGEWVTTTLYSFPAAQGNPADPRSLVLGKTGNLYGIAYEAGIVNSNCKFGCGFVYELRPTSSGAWKYTTLYSFQGGTDGANPSGPLLLDKYGNLYGTAQLGGAGGAGVAFEVEHTAPGVWSESVLYAFTGGDDGEYPAALAADGLGNLYGVASGGSLGYGTVFELSPRSASSWNFETLYSFGGIAQHDGAVPTGNLLFREGNLVGTTYEGGDPACGGGGGCGTIFGLALGSKGGVEHVLHRFRGTDGAQPSGLATDTSGNLYGSAAAGGIGDCGTAYELSPASGFTVLYDFAGGSNGCHPGGALTVDGAGNVYGTAESYGAFNLGVAYELQPE